MNRNNTLNENPINSISEAKVCLEKINQGPMKEIDEVYKLNDTLLFIVDDLKNLLSYKVNYLFNLCGENKKNKYTLLERLTTACEENNWQDYAKKYPANNMVGKMFIYFNGVLNANDPAYLKKTEVYSEIIQRKLFSDISTIDEQRKAINAIQSILKDSFRKQIKELSNNELQRQ